MNKFAREISRLAGEGYCCSQILIKIGLDSRGDDNPELVDAVAGLCQGLFSGLCCGTLTGAACLLSLYDKEKAESHMIPALVEWFQATCAASYGGITCDDIVAADAVKKMERCPKLVLETLEKCRELLAEFGHEL
jgi:hypothetical protein